MKTHTIKTYAITELSPKAREKALEEYRYWNVENQDWWENVIEEAKALGVQFGYKDMEIFFHHPISDLVYFKSRINLEKWEKEINKYAELKKLYDEDTESFKIYTKTTRGEYMTVEADFTEGGQSDLLLEQLEKLRASVEFNAKDFAKQTNKAIAAEYDALIADPVLIEYFNANDYEFKENGEMYTK